MSYNLLDDIVWIKKYPIDSLQVYFSASLELQEELIRHGFQVPRSVDGRIKTPIPLIYSNFRGWIKQPEPITIERLIPPEWLGLKPKDLNWRETRHRGKRAYYLPPEEVYVEVGYDTQKNIYFKLDIKEYHLERISIRGINPEKWNNWAMFYISIDYYDELLNLLSDMVKPRLLLSTPIRIRKEQQQGGKEITYYAYIPGKEVIGVPIKYFSLCLGCFPRALDYFKIKAKEHKLPLHILDNIKFRLEYDHNINIGIKVGAAKIIGKYPQIMFKLASDTPKKIHGIIKKVIEGKARGKLVYCDHTNKVQYFVVDGKILYAALNATKPYLRKLPSDEEHVKLLLKKVKRS